LLVCRLRKIVFLDIFSLQGYFHVHDRVLLVGQTKQLPGLYFPTNDSQRRRHLVALYGGQESICEHTDGL
jgi:hypothetical protein